MNRAAAARRAMCAVVAATLVGACGASSSGGGGKSSNESAAAPAAELSDAVHALGAGRSLSLSLSLHMTPAELIRVSKLDGGTPPPPGAVTALTTDHIAIELEAPAGETIGQAAAGKSMSVAMTLGSTSDDYADFRVIGGSLYGKLNLKYFFDLSGESAQYAALQRQAARLPDFVRAAAAGQWVSLPASTLQSFEGLAQGELHGKLPQTSEFTAVRGQLLSTLLRDLTVSRISAGATDHLGVTFSLPTVLRDEYAVVKPLVDQFAALGGATPSPDFSQIPDRSVDLDAYVAQGALSELTLDAGQFDPKHRGYHIPIDLSFSTTGPDITVPEGAVPITFTALGELFSSLGGGPAA